MKRARFLTDTRAKVPSKFRSHVAHGMRASRIECGKSRSSPPTYIKDCLHGRAPFPALPTGLVLSTKLSIVVSK